IARLSLAPRRRLPAHRLPALRPRSSPLLGAHASTARRRDTRPPRLIELARQAVGHQEFYRFFFSARRAPNRQTSMTSIPRVDSSLEAACRPANRQWPDIGALPGIPWSVLARARARLWLFYNFPSGADRVRRRASSRDLSPVSRAESPCTSRPLIRDLGISIVDAANATRYPRHRGAQWRAITIVLRSEGSLCASRAAPNYYNSVNSPGPQVRLL